MLVLLQFVYIFKSILSYWLSISGILMEAHISDAIVMLEK
jgi:hypothetical protein